MYMTDFEYDGETLSDYGCVIGFLNSSMEESTPMHGGLALTTVKNREINNIIVSSYSDVLKFSFGVIKNQCSSNHQSFDEDDIRRLMSWVGRKKYLKFKPIYNDDNFADLYFMGVFTNVEAVKIGSDVAGFNLTLETNAPYGFFEEENVTRTLTASLPSMRVVNYSEEEGYLYPAKVTIQCNAAGKLRLTNDKDSHYPLVINNCVQGEVFTLDCKNKIITTSKQSHTRLFNDFNYNWIRLVSEYNEETVNTITLDTNQLSEAVVSITYSPIRKVGAIL